MCHEIHNELWASRYTMCFFLSSKLYFKGTLSDNAENSIIYLTRPVKSLTGKSIQESDTYIFLKYSVTS